MHLALITESPGAPAGERKNKHSEGVRRLETIEACILSTSGGAAWRHFIKPVSQPDFALRRQAALSAHVFQTSQPNGVSAARFIS